MNSSSSTPSLPPKREYTFIVLTPAAAAMRRTVRAVGPSVASRSWAAASRASRVSSVLPARERGEAGAWAIGRSPYSAVPFVM